MNSSKEKDARMDGKIGDGDHFCPKSNPKPWSMFCFREVWKRRLFFKVLDVIGWWRPGLKKKMVRAF